MQTKTLHTKKLDLAHTPGHQPAKFSKKGETPFHARRTQAQVDYVAEIMKRSARGR